jgi:anti-sigma regulatory factor (Ser/Thr protein kinase)
MNARAARIMTGVGTGAHVRVEVAEHSQVGQARRDAGSLAEACGLRETDVGTVAVIVSEFATNLVKHAKHGELLLRIVTAEGAVGVEVLCLDRGPGMRNVHHAVLDGHSTSGTAGTGLGAVRRMAEEFDIYSRPGKGTALVARVWKRGQGTPPCSGGMQTGVVCVAKPGEEICGDGWMQEHDTVCSLYAVADGLGHGPAAAQASRAAFEALCGHPNMGPSGHIEAAHRALRGTRGVALAVAEIWKDEEFVRFAGIGNVSGVVIERDGRRHGMVSSNGIVGHQLHRVREFHYPWSEQAMLIMHSDGISTHWDLADYPGLISRDPALIAAVLYRDFTRGRDDSTVLVARHVGHELEARP